MNITQIEHDGQTFDLATQADGADTAYWLIADGALIVSGTAEETTAEELAAGFDFYGLVLAGLLTVTAETGDDDYFWQVQHDWCTDRI